MATHSSIPSWRILWTEEPGGFLVLRVTKSWTRHIHTLTHKDDLGVRHKREEGTEGGLDTWTRSGQYKQKVSHLFIFACFPHLKRHIQKKKNIAKTNLQECTMFSSRSFMVSGL